MLQFMQAQIYCNRICNELWVIFFSLVDVQCTFASKTQNAYNECTHENLFNATGSWSLVRKKGKRDKDWDTKREKEIEKWEKMKKERELWKKSEHKVNIKLRSKTKSNKIGWYTMSRKTVRKRPLGYIDKQKYKCKVWKKENKRRTFDRWNKMKWHKI